MKKFFITYKDGSKQTLMPAMHDTRKKAEEALMDYVHHHNKRSDCFLSVFDFAIKEDEVSEILDFEIAKQVVGSSEFVLARESLRFSDVELNMKHIGALIALNKLFAIAAAWNKLDGFVPDFSNWSQNKWTPVFAHIASTKRLELSTTCMFSEVNESFGFVLRHVHGSLELSF